MGSRTRIHYRYGLILALGMVWLLVACRTQPAKYRHSNDCKCPKWNHVPPPPVGMERAASRPTATPYHCGTERNS